MNTSTYDYMCANIRKSRILTKEEETALMHRAKQGDRRAANKIITSNQRFILATAYRYKYTGVPIEDLVSAGNIGAIEAIKRFDESMECRFTTFAIWWIRLYMIRLITEMSRPVSLPQSATNWLCKYSKTVDKLAQEKSRIPDDQEVLSALSDLPLVADLTPAIAPPLRVDSAAAGKDPVVQNFYVENYTGNETDDDINKDDCDVKDKLLRMATRKLTNREREILIRCVGNNETLESVGGKHSMCKERVRQIRNIAITKARVTARFLKKRDII